MRNRICAWVSIVLVGLEVLLILSSWIATAAMPDLHMRSLLGSYGIRWMFGHFTENLNVSMLVEIILLIIGGGAMINSGLVRSAHNLIARRRLRYLERIGLGVVIAELVAFIVAVVLLAFIPHAVLLSVTGHLFPSSFSESMLPAIAFAMVVCSLSFGIASGRLTTVEQVYASLTYGLGRCAWIFPIYIFALQLYGSIRFVLIL